MFSPVMKIKISVNDSISSDVILGHIFAYNELYICFAFIRTEMLMVREPSLLSCSPSFCLPQVLLSWNGLYYDPF